MRSDRLRRVRTFSDATVAGPEQALLARLYRTGPGRTSSKFKSLKESVRYRRPAGNAGIGVKASKGVISSRVACVPPLPTLEAKPLLEPLMALLPFKETPPLPAMPPKVPKNPLPPFPAFATLPPEL